MRLRLPCGEGGLGCGITEDGIERWMGQGKGELELDLELDLGAGVYRAYLL